MRRWWCQHLLRGTRIPAHQWQWYVLQLPVLPHLFWQDVLRMDESASLFLHHEPTCRVGGVFFLHSFLNLARWPGVPNEWKFDLSDNDNHLGRMRGQRQVNAT